MEQFETRLANLERANARYRAGLTVSLVLLGVVCLAGFGQVGQQQQVYPRNIVADSITVTSVNAVTGTIGQIGTNTANVGFLNLTDGRAEGLTVKLANVANLQAQRAALGKATANQVDVVAPNGAGVTLAASGDSGAVTVSTAQNKVVAFLGGRNSAGLLQLNGETGFVGLEGTVENKGGLVRIVSDSGRSLITMKRTREGDGEIATCNSSGNRLVVARAADDQKSGKLVVYKEGAFPMVTLGMDAKGGLVQTQDEKNETARLPGK